MKLCVFGQGSGGNAAMWFSHFNEHIREIEEITDFAYICRGPCKFKSNFKTVKLYGTGGGSFLYKVYCAFLVRGGAELFFRYYFSRHEFDVIHLQGNYSPTLNLGVMKNAKSKFVLNLYGSDFYRKYLLGEFSEVEKKNFEEVVARADHVTCNWIRTEKDFRKAFPNYGDKVSTIFWGATSAWFEPASKKLDFDAGDTVFLSARALYDYNNVDIVVEAFCKAFENREGFKLVLVSGYGSQGPVIQKVRAIIEKYGASESVIFRIGGWVSDEEMMALYERADYNICFGSTDQLSISINYALIKKAKNILSPIPNYFDLAEIGYRSLAIMPEISVQALEDYFCNSLGRDEDELEHDRVKANEDFYFSKNFERYVALYEKLSLNESIQ